MGEISKVGIVGGSGYTGVELLRLLVPRDDVEIVFVGSRQLAGKRVDAEFPSLRGHTDLAFADVDDETLLASGCELVFFATPNGVAMRRAPRLLEAGVRVVDLSADFRLRDVGVWQRWYEPEHASPEWVERAVYGLPETRRGEIATAALVANPGCYPTAVQLGFLPLLESGAVDPATLIADAKSGVSGAGRGASVATLLAEAADSFKAYAVAGHRHLPEIEQELSAMGAGEIRLTFTPHLLPLIRGIHATLYATLTDPELDLQALYERRYADEPFVDVLPAGSHPETRTVRGSNVCRLAVHRPQGRATAVVLAVEDNLVKGAAGQAVQNMNLMLGRPESAGLGAPALCP